MFLCVGYIIFHVFLCDTFTHILQGRFINNGAILWLPLCQWKKLENMDKSATTQLHQERTKYELCAYFLGVLYNVMMMLFIFKKHVHCYLDLEFAI